MELLAKAKELLSFETTSQSGTKAFGEVLKKLYPDFLWKATKDESGCALHYFETNENSNKIDLLIYGNVDTVNSSSLSLWTETECDPLNITFKKNKLYGLGASHEKISLVPVLNALEKTKTKINAVFVAGYGREMNMIGAKRTISEVVQKRSVEKIIVLQPTESNFLNKSLGRTKIEVFFPFSDEEKKLKEEHDLRENIFSQSKIFNKKGEESLNEDVIFKALKSFSLLPSGTLLLDFSGGTGTITEAQSVYFEIDAAPTLEVSMISRLEGLSKTLNKVNIALLDKFKLLKPSKALHLGKASTTTEGVFFYGYNLIPPGVSVADLNSWFNEFSNQVENFGGQVRVRDNKKPFQNEKSVTKETGSLQVTEATVFSRYYSDIQIFGAGKEGLQHKPNELVSLNQLKDSEERFDGFLNKFNSKEDL